MIKYIYIAILYIDLPVIYGQEGKKSWGPEGWAGGLGRRRRPTNIIRNPESIPQPSPRPLTKHYYKFTIIYIYIFIYN